MALIKIVDPIALSDSHSAQDDGVSIGIDFGTTNSLACLHLNGLSYLATESGRFVRVETKPSDICSSNLDTTHGSGIAVAGVASNKPTIILEQDYSECLIPSAIAISKDGNFTFGRNALLLMHNKDYIVVRSVKRLIALLFGNESNEETDQEANSILKESISQSGVSILPATSGDAHLPSIVVFGRVISVVQLTSALFSFIKGVALKSFADLGLPGGKLGCVITVPAHFGDIQRRAIMVAAELAGLRVSRMINEPTAAALAYNIPPSKPFDGEGDEVCYAVYDLGGGTFDASLVQFHDGLLRVIASVGNTLLGGDDFDVAILNIIRQKLPSFTGDNLLAFAQNIKHLLSTQNKDYRTQYNGAELVVTLDEYNRAILPFVDQTFYYLDDILARYCNLDGKTEDDRPRLGAILLVGGSTRNSVIRSSLSERYSCPILCSISPDIAVAVGASVQAAILDKRLKDRLLIDVAPFSIGIETIGGLVEKMIRKNTTLPISITENFTTSKDNQTAVEINVFQGERGLTNHSNLLGKFVLGGIPPMIAGKPIVEVTFSLDVDGILNISAVEKRSQSSTSVTINSAYNLDIEKLREDQTEAAENLRSDNKEKMYRQSIADASVMLSHADRILRDISLAHRESDVPNFQYALDACNELHRVIESSGSFGLITELYWRIESLMSPILEHYLRMKVIGHIATPPGDQKTTV